MAEKILIIDDDLDTLQLVGGMLRQHGYQAVAASNGVQGLHKTHEEIPDLIMLDIMMPDMDGYEVARHLREDPQSKEIPILMFTAKTQLDDKIAGFEVGADGYVTKPTHPKELLLQVKTLLRRSEKLESEQIKSQPSIVENAEKPVHQQKKRLSFDDLIRTHFSTWFINPPPSN